MWAFKKELYKLSSIRGSMFIACDELTSIAGNEGVFIINMELGTDIGIVNLDYNAIGVPDRFQIEWDGNIVADSKYVGNNLGGNPPDNTGTGGPLVGTTFSNIPEYEYDGNQMVLTGNNLTFTVQQSDVADGTASEPIAGIGTISFAKTSALPSTARIIIYAPLGGTAFSVEPNCPVPPPAILVNLGEGSKSESACEQSFGLTGNYYILSSQTFETATQLYTDLQATTLAPSRWYANQNVARFWTGTAFNNSIEYTCTVRPVELGFDVASDVSACSDFNTTPSTLYIPILNNFSNATEIFDSNTGAIFAPQGFYSDGTIWREWDGSNFINNGNC